MWDTSKDYRLRVAERAVELFIATLDGSVLKGNWNKKQALQTAKNMMPDIQTLYYSYLEPEDMADSEQIKSLLAKESHIIQALGGKEWHQQFMLMANKSDKQRLEESLAKIRFFLNTIHGLGDRLALGNINDPIIGVDLCVGEVLSVSKHPDMDNLLVCNVKIGKKALTVVTNDLQMREGNRVAVALLPPSVFHGITSEGMFLGDNRGVLKDVKGNSGEMPRKIPLESLNETRNMVEIFLQK